MSNTRIQSLVENFTRDLMSEMGNLSAAEIMAFSNVHPRAAQPGRQGRSASSSFNGGGASISPAEIIGALGGAPSGLRAEEIRSKLGASKQSFIKAAKQAMASGVIVKFGEKRSTIYKLAPQPVEEEPAEEPDTNITEPQRVLGPTDRVIRRNRKQK